MLDGMGCELWMWRGCEEGVIWRECRGDALDVREREEEPNNDDEAKLKVMESRKKLIRRSDAQYVSDIRYCEACQYGVIWADHVQELR
jgi:hypothetical protein